MDTGTKISAGAHAALLGYVLVGPVFNSEPLPMMVQEVSVISSAEFAALTAPSAAPEVETSVALPQIEQPDPVAQDPPQVQEAPEVVPEPEPDVEAAPVLPQIQPEPDPEVIEEPPAPPQEDVAVLAPEAETPVPDQADRIAPEPTEAPEPEATPDPQVREEITEDSQGEAEQEPQDATAPEQTTTEIVTEADTPAAAAPTRSIRPPSNRPTRPVETAQPAPEPEPDQSDTTASAIAAAVAEAQQQPSTAPAARTGPPLTGSELEGLRVAVSSCWNVGALSTEAQETTVTVFVFMNRDGTPDTGSIRMVSSEGGSDAAARRVFDTARRAIIRCGARGFPLPVDKYNQWREIEMRFNPEGMFFR